MSFKNKDICRNTIFIKLLVLLTICVALYIRDHSSFTYPQFFAEDGMFFQQNIIFGWKAFLISYAGYFHTIIRTIAWISGYFPFTWQPWLYAYCSLFVLLVVALKILGERLPFPMYVRVLMALSIVLVPTNGETLMILVNLQPITALLLIILLIQNEPENLFQKISDYFITIFIGLSGPFLVIFSPLFFCKYLLKRNKYNFMLLLFVLIAAIIQLVFRQNLGHVNVNSLLQIRWLDYFGVHVLKTFFDTPLFLAENYFLSINIICIILLWILLPIFIYPRNKYILILLTIMIILIAISAIRVPTGAAAHYILALTIGDRYSYIPTVLFAWVLILSIYYLPKGWKKNISIVLLILLFNHSINNFHTHQRPFIYHWDEYKTKVTTPDDFFITINPSPGWRIHCINYSCDRNLYKKEQ